jgi:hypothetical protein
VHVIARLNGAQTKCFTDGKTYEAYKEPGKEYCNTWVVRDDFGHERVILPNQPCPHLKTRVTHPFTFEVEKCVGVFETVKE